MGQKSSFKSVIFYCSLFVGRLLLEFRAITSKSCLKRLKPGVLSRMNVMAAGEHLQSFADCVADLTIAWMVMTLNKCFFYSFFCTFCEESM